MSTTACPETEDDDYESLPETTSRMVHLFAGGLAGISEHCIMYPFDAIKVSTQKQRD